MSLSQKYLEILGIERRSPSVDYLRALVRAQLLHFPYENISKLMRASRGLFDLPSYEEYLEENLRFGFGGTCYPQNIYFAELLTRLGFNVQLLTTSVNEKLRHHVCCRVTLSDSTQIVDFGFMDAFSGPFDENGPQIEEILGGRVFKFIPKGPGKFRIEIHQDTGLQRYFESLDPIQDLNERKTIVHESFHADALFMKSLVIGKRSGDPCFNIWNDEVIVTRENRTERHKIPHLTELKRIIKEDMKLPFFPIEEAIEVLRSRGIVIYKNF